MLVREPEIFSQIVSIESIQGLSVSLNIKCQFNFWHCHFAVQLRNVVSFQVSIYLE